MHPTDDQSDGKLERTLGGLEHLAGELDARKYPGQAWPVARARPTARRQWIWKIGISIAAAAAGIVVAFHYWAAPLPPAHTIGDPHSIVKGVAPATSPAFDESALPRIVILEDMDSYSIIDLNNRVPLVSFVSKRALSLDDATPVLVDAASDAGL